RTSAPRPAVPPAWTSPGRPVVWSCGGTRRPGRARLGARRAARLRARHGGALRRALASSSPRGVPGHPGCRARGGHRPGVLPRRDPEPRPLRPPPALRALAPPDRREPRDRRGAGPEPPQRDGADRARDGRGRARAARPRAARSARTASARPAGRDRSPPPARLHTRRDRSDARPAPRHRQLTPAPRTGHDAGRAVKDALERIPVPDEEPARERAHKVVLTAFAGREPVRRPSQARRVALGVGVAALAVELAVASPPGMAVVDRVREVVAVERTAPALFSLPAPGRLLVASDAGVWVVDADGRKRLLAGYREASWSPSGRFLVATG